MPVIACVSAPYAWVTQVQSKFGARPGSIAGAFSGNVSKTDALYPYSILGYYWHMPLQADDNRGLGGGITWAWDDNLCANEFGERNTAPLEDKFLEDFFFAPFNLK